MFGKIIAATATAISIIMLYFATIPFEGMGDTGEFAFQLGRCFSWAIQCALFAFWLARVSKRNIGKAVYATLIITWTGFYSYSHYNQGMAEIAFQKETVAILEANDTLEDLDEFSQLAPAFMQIKALQRSQERFFGEFEENLEQLDLPDAVRPELLLEVEGRTIAQNKLELFSQYIDSLDKERIAYNGKVKELTEVLYEGNEEFAKSFELGYREHSVLHSPLILEKIKLMKNSARIIGKLIDFYDVNHQEMSLIDGELVVFKDEVIDELEFIFYQLQYNESKEEEVTLKIMNFTENLASNLDVNALR